jgi:hypothetical protein
VASRQVADTAKLFLDADGAPRLQRCALLFLDMLGVSAMARSEQAAEHLAAVDRAVRNSFRDFLGPATELPSAVFSDSLVIAAPVPSKALERSTIVGLINQAAFAQLGLIEQGLFSRGGVAVGDFHIHDGLIFGRALVDAYERESRDAIHPRVVLDRPVEDILLKDCAELGNLLMCDEDGWSFIDYLGPLFDTIHDARPRVQAHRDTLVARLAEHSRNRRRWEKYRWVAEYHNEVVNTRLTDSASLLVPQGALTWRFRAFGS